MFALISSLLALDLILVCVSLWWMLPGLPGLLPARARR